MFSLGHLRVRQSWSAAFSLTAVAWLSAGPGWSSSTGIAGKTGRVQSCVECHTQDGSSQVFAPTITISALEEPVQWAAGTEIGFEIRARRSSLSSNRYAGFNAEVQYASWGALEVTGASDGVKTHQVADVPREVSHDASKDFLLGASLEGDSTVYEVAWSFYVRLPNHFPSGGDGQVDVFAAVNNTNGAGPTGDYVATAHASFERSSLAIECGRVGAPEIPCETTTFDPQLHPYEQAIPCCCPDADDDAFMAAFCNPYPAEAGGDCLDEGVLAHRVNPSQNESDAMNRCDAVDNDCNGIVDDLFAPELGPLCAATADCPEGYVCNAARDYLNPRCGMPCAEVLGADENTSYVCNAGALQCLDTTAVELCNGIDDDGDGLVDENFVNGTPPLGTPCTWAGETGVVICDALGTGMICGDPPVQDAGVYHDSGSGSADSPWPANWAFFDGGLYMPHHDGGWVLAPVPDGGFRTFGDEALDGGSSTERPIGEDGGAEPEASDAATVSMEGAITDAGVPTAAQAPDSGRVDPSVDPEAVLESGNQSGAPVDVEDEPRETGGCTCSVAEVAPVGFNANLLGFLLLVLGLRPRRTSKHRSF